MNKRARRLATIRKNHFFNLEFIGIHPFFVCFRQFIKYLLESQGEIGYTMKREKMKIL